MALNDTAKNLALDALGTAITHLSLHSAANAGAEISGGSPAYARKAITFDPATGAVLSASGSVSFDVPGGATVTHVGYWSAATGGSNYGYEAVTSETFGNQGIFQVPSVDISITG